MNAVRDYLYQVVWNIWVGVLAALVTVYELLRGFTSPEFLPPIPRLAYWTLGLALLFVAPFRAFLQERRRADRYEALCRQVFEETFVFLNYGRESRRAPAIVIEKGREFLEELEKEVQRGDYSRAGMVVPLFHEMQNLILDYYATGPEFRYFQDRFVVLVDKVLTEGFTSRPISAGLRSEAYEIYRERWAQRRTAS